MRKRIFIGVFLLVWLFQVIASPVTREDINRVTGAFVASVFPPATWYEIGDIKPMTRGADIPLYIVNLKPGGWLLLSGDDRLTPVLGYAFSGIFDLNFPVQHSVRYWVNSYSDEVVSAMHDRTLKRNALWDGTKETYALKSASAATVEPLIDVEWNQNSSWNRFCPVDEDGPGGRAYVGCVGVAIAQAMSVYKYPVQPTGSKTYYHDTYGTIIVHYDRETPYQWDSMALDVADIFNSKLLYHTAVSVEMDFGATGSSSQAKSAATALSKYFKYYSGVKYVDRYANEQEWIDLLTAELSSGRPVIYSGFPEDDSPGHAFNIDGVDTRGYFHLNWGWSGKYNGYYLINNLRPGTDNFTQRQGAVINIRPPLYCPTDLSLTKTSVMEGKPAGTYVGRLKITDEATDNTYDIRVKGDSVGDSIYLDPGFYVSNDSLKTTREFLYSEGNSVIYIEVEDQSGNRYQEKFTISILKDPAVSTGSGQEEKLEIYPNPAPGWLMIRSPFPGRFLAELTDQQGRVVARLEGEGSGGILRVNSRLPGIYFLKVIPENHDPVIRKIVIY